MIYSILLTTFIDNQKTCIQKIEITLKIDLILINMLIVDNYLAFQLAILEWNLDSMESHKFPILSPWKKGRPRYEMRILSIFMLVDLAIN